MRGEHGGSGGGRQPAVAIAAMDHPRPGNPLAYTVFTDVSITEQGARGTEHAEIVQRLYDRNRGFIGRIINGGRNDRESIVDVNDVRPFALHQGKQLAVGLLIPDGIAKQDQWVLALHLLVAGKASDTDIRTIHYVSLLFG